MTVVREATVTNVMQACVLPKFLVVGYDDEDGYSTEEFFEKADPAYEHAQVLEVFDYEVEVYDIDLGYEPVWPF